MDENCKYFSKNLVSEVYEIQVNLLELIRQAFRKTVFSEYKQDKIWWDERNIVGVFYHILRPVVDLMPEYELYWEWYVKFYEGNKGNCFVDLALVENVSIEDNEGDIETIEAFVRVAIEFKWVYGSNYEKILKDVKNLSKMIEKGSKDVEYDLEDGIIRVNKGNT